MSKQITFNKLSPTQKIMLEAYSANNMLKKIRLKIDPVNRNAENLARLNGYEGYILSEDEEGRTIDVMVIGDLDEPVIKNLPCDCVDQDSIVDPLTKFKIAVNTYLRHKLDIEEDNKIYAYIDIANSHKEIEKELKKFGLNKEAICEIYKLYVLTNEPIC